MHRDCGADASSNMANRSAIESAVSGSKRSVLYSLFRHFPRFPPRPQAFAQTQQQVEFGHPSPSGSSRTAKPGSCKLLVVRKTNITWKYGCRASDRAPASPASTTRLRRHVLMVSASEGKLSHPAHQFTKAGITRASARITKASTKSRQDPPAPVHPAPQRRYRSDVVARAAAREQRGEPAWRTMNKLARLRVRRLSRRRGKLT